MCSFSKGHGYSKADLADSGTPIILYGRLYTKYQTQINEVDTYASPIEGSLYSQSNEVIVPASGETADDIAIASFVNLPGVLLGGDINVVRPATCLDPAFLAFGLSNGGPHDQLAMRAQGKSVVHVHNEDIAEVEFAFPTVREQRRIANTILGLDNLITLHQRKLELLKSIKKSMLDGMFA